MDNNNDCSNAFCNDIYLVGVSNNRGSMKPKPYHYNKYRRKRKAKEGIDNRIMYMEE